MGLEQLLGNEALKERLTEGLRSGRLSHSYLLTGPEGSGNAPWPGFWLPPWNAAAHRGPAASVPPAARSCRAITPM